MRTPGFVDLQVNGYKGVDFSGPELTADRFRAACRGVLNNGTAAFLPTLVTSAENTYRRNLPLMAEIMREDEFAGRLLGFHVEGPFISPETGAVGAHNPAWVRDPDPDMLERMIEWSEGRIRLLTVAAERPGAEEFIRHASGRRICVSLGHQLASGVDLARAQAAGARALTHLGNGIPNLLPRHPNPIWEGLAADGLFMLVIADGHHLSAPVLKAMLRAKGLENSAVVSDASSLAGMPPGRYPSFDGELVLEENGRLHDPKKGYLAGSSYTMLECMNFLHAQKWHDLAALFKLGIDNPLKLIGLDRGRVFMNEILEYDGKAFLPTR